MEQLVITPGGLRPRSNVHLIENGFQVNFKDGVLSKVNSVTNEIVADLGMIDSAKREQAISRNILRTGYIDMMSKTEKLQSSPITDRWIIYSGWMNDSNTPISYFSTKWIVPPPPSTDNGQLIYLFNGIETSNFDVILQPVLQWGRSHAGGGSYWAIANWFVGTPATGIALHSDLVQVNSGDSIEGIMILESQSEDKFSYLSMFKNVQQCDLRITGINELKWANETLECYGFKEFSDYPNSVVTPMTNIDIRIGSTQAKLVWEAHNDVTDNGQHCIIVSNSSPGGRVDLYYTNQLA